jgi:hypothetical protein
MSVNILENLSNVVFIGAYWVKDILWLRLLAMLGSLVVIPYYYLLEAKPLWTPIMWSGIHATRAWGIVKERRPVTFTRDEQFLYDKTFSTLSPRQFNRLLAIGEWQDLDRGYVLHTAGEPPDSLEAVVRGELEARRDGRLLGRAGPGDLAGLASVLGGSPELFDATVTQPARVIRWRVADLQKLAGADESLTSALRKIGAAAIADKLIRAVQGGWTLRPGEGGGIS